MADKPPLPPQHTQDITITSIIESIDKLGSDIAYASKTDNATTTVGKGGGSITADASKTDNATTTVGEGGGSITADASKTDNATTTVGEGGGSITADASKTDNATTTVGEGGGSITVDQKESSAPAIDDKNEESSGKKKESESDSICNVLPKWVLSCGKGKKEHHGDDRSSQGSVRGGDKSSQGSVRGGDSSHCEDTLSPMVKLNINLEQMKVALKKLQRYEMELQEKIERANKTSTNAMNTLKAAQLSGASSSSTGAQEDEAKVLRDLVKEVRKLRHQIPALHKSSFKDSGAHDRDSGSSIDGVRTNMEIYNLPSMQMSTSFQQSSVVTEIGEIYEGLECQKKKDCLLCFAVFPENEELKKRTLTYWWEGEGLLPVPKHGETVEKLARDFLDDFVNKGLIEPSYKKGRKKARSYRMNPIVHGAVVKIAEEKKFFLYDKKGNPTAIFDIEKDEKMDGKKDEKICTKACLLKAEKVTATPQQQEKKGNGEKQEGQGEKKGNGKKQEGQGEKKGNGEKQEGQGEKKGNGKKQEGQGEKKGNGEKQEGQGEKKGNGKKKNGSKDTKGPDFTVEMKVETIFNFNEPFPDLRMESFAKKKEADVAEWLSKLEKLKVLHLGRWQASVKHHIEVEKTDFLEGLKKMGNLRLLSLQGVSRIDELTRSIKGLTNLKILDLKACHNLEVLPKEISYLKNLTHLDLSDCYLIDHMPKGLSYLTNLQVLEGFVVGHQKSQRTGKYCTVDGLKGMKKLRKLSLNISNKDFPSTEELGALAKLTSLKKLTMSWGADLNTEKNTQESQESTQETANEEAVKGIPGKKGLQKLLTIADHGNLQPSLSEPQGPQLPSGLEKLSLLCFPHVKSPTWLEPKKLPKLLKLCIRGGHFGELKKNQKKWGSVKTLRLKFLSEVKMSWQELREEFPKLECLEKVGCPRITFCPCDDNGVWVKPDEEVEQSKETGSPAQPANGDQPGSEIEEDKVQAKQSEEVEDKAQAKPAEQPKKPEQSAQPEKAREPEKKKQTQEPKKPEQKSEKTKQSEDAKKSEQSKSESEQPKKPKQSEEAEKAKKSEQSGKSEQSKS